MKHLFQALVFLFLVISTIAFSKGNKKKALTLTNGQYEEFFDTDSIEQIGSVLYNVNTQKIEGFTETSNEEDEVLISPNIISRWLSLDPLASKYPSISPYVFVANNPILYVDPDGKQIFVYGKQIEEFTSLIKNGTNLNVKYNHENNQLVLSAPEGYTPNAREKVLLAASADPNINVNMYTTKSRSIVTKEGKSIGLRGGAFGGNTLSVSLFGGFPFLSINTEQFVNVDNLNAMKSVGTNPSSEAIHEVMESYRGALFPNAKSGLDRNPAGQAAHVFANDTDPGGVNPDVTYDNRDDAILIARNKNNPSSFVTLYDKEERPYGVTSNDIRRETPAPPSPSPSAGPTGCMDNIPTIPTSR